MRFSVEVFGDKLVATKFTRMAVDARQTRPAFVQIANYLMEITSRQFDTQGRRAGGSWRKLTSDWVGRKTALGGDPRILHFRGALRKSVTRRGTKGSILEYGRDSLNFGSSLDYAAAHQFGNAHLPARPFLKTTPMDRKIMRDMIQDHLMQAWRKKQVRR